MSLDPAKLVGATRLAGKTVAQCPVCAANGADQSRNHLVVFDTGKFGCVVDDSPAHSKAIWQLVGHGGSGEAALDLGAPPEAPVFEEPPRVWEADLLPRLLKDHSYWAGRGISEETVAPFRGGVATTGQLAGRYVFPIFNEDDEIVGFDARCLKPLSAEERKRIGRPKWKHLGRSSSFVWGGLDAVEEYRRVVLTESVGDSLMLREHGVPETLCLFGTNLSEALLAHLISVNPLSIVISTNLDEPKLMSGRMVRPGQAAAIRIKRTLDAFFDEGVAVIVHPTSKDWGCSSREEIHATFLPPPEAALTEAAIQDEPATPLSPTPSLAITDADYAYATEPLEGGCDGRPPEREIGS